MERNILFLHADFTNQIYLQVSFFLFSFFGFVTFMGQTSLSLLMYTKVNVKFGYLKFNLQPNHSEGYGGVFVS